MVNLVRVAPSLAEDDPQIEAAKQQLAMAIQAQQGMRATQLPIAEGRGAVQAQYGWGNALADLAGQLASAYNTRMARTKYESVRGAQDKALEADTRAKIEALSPSMIPGKQTPANITLDAVPSSAPDANAMLAGALAQQQPSPLAPPGQDQPVTLGATRGTPDMPNPDHAALLSAVAGLPPRQANEALGSAIFRNMLPDPAVVESQKMRRAMFDASEADKAATLEDRRQGRADTLAARQDAQERDLALRRELAQNRAAEKAQLDAMSDEGLRDRAAKIVAYEAAPPSGMGQNSPGATKLWQYIHEEEKRAGKSYDQTKYNYYNAGRKEFTMGKKSDLIRSLDVARRHIDTLEPMIDALKNGDYRAFNILGNSLGVQMGETPVTNYQMGADILGKEVEKALVPNGGTGEERKESVAKFGPNGSPKSMHEGLDVARKFLGGQFAGLMRQGSASTGWDQARLREELQLPPELSGDAFGIGPAGGGAAAGTAPKPTAKVASDADFNALPSGTVFTAPDGSVRRKP